MNVMKIESNVSVYLLKCYVNKCFYLSVCTYKYIYCETLTQHEVRTVGRRHERSKSLV